MLFSKVLVVLVVLWTSSLSAYAIETKLSEFTLPGGNTIAVAIAKPDGEGPFPAVILQRGRSGSLDQYKNALPRYAKNGFYTFAIDSNVGRDQIDYAADRISAVVGIIKKMTDIKPDRIGVWGLSNGGAAVLTFLEKNSVKAAVIYGATYQWAPDGASLTKGPLLLLHGADDNTVPVGLAKQYSEKLMGVNNQAILRIMEGKGHSWDSDAMSESIAFFNKYLK